MKNYLILIFCMSFKKVQTNDIFFNSTVKTVWDSTIFTIPVEPPFNLFGSFCLSKSIYYCLTSFKVRTIEMNPAAFEYRSPDILRGSREPYEILARLKRNGLGQFNIVFRPSYEKHNFFVIKDGCCGGQFVWYFNYGFKEALLTPIEYFERLTDYSGEKHLNYIKSFYNIDCKVNVITKIGFGNGKLSREFTRYKYYSRWISIIWKRFAASIYF